MADKAGRALVIYGDGIMGALGPCHQHLHALASLGTCGFLALRDAPRELKEEERVVRELSQLLDVHDLCNKEKEFEDSSNTLGHSSGYCSKHTNIPTIAERFMGMKAAMVTNSGTANAFGKRVGFSVTALHELCNKTGISEEPEVPPDPLSAASKLLSMLGLQEKTVEENTASRLYLALVLSYGSISSDKSDDSSLLISLEEISPSLASLLPCQSYTMKEGKLLNDVRHHHPMLAVQHQEAVTRRDGAKIFSFEEFQEEMKKEIRRSHKKHSLTRRHDLQHQQHGVTREGIPKKRSSDDIKNSFQGNINTSKLGSVLCTSMIKVFKSILSEELIKVRKSSSSSLRVDNVEYQEIFLHDYLSSLQVQVEGRILVIIPVTISTN
ncbi:uncharacterized protein LOC131060675 isoform X3 [Cryptomeria japonica]|uniref:uncharacterized protein LOC131060675 isoform X3 n=1 Tax=Cryptomeria japonica TaxID=3369 RepID=UPI0025ACFEA3|nr:uncharacterized protein LOC131060675 isoform X3 [Cryptomeria japonica]